MSEGKLIVRATALIIFMGILSKLTGLIRDTVIAQKFGATALTDAYVVANTIPTLLFYVVIGALAVVVVPVFSEYSARGEEKEAWKLFVTVTNIIMIILTFFSVLGMFFTRALVGVVAPDLAPATAKLAAGLTLLMFPMLVFSALSNLFSGLLNARNIFGIPAFSVVANNLTIIAAALLLAPRLGIRGLALGTAAAMAVSVAVQLPALKKAGFSYRPLLDWHHPGVKKVLSLMIPITIGLSANQGYILIDRILASSLREGSISALNYAQKVMLVPVGLFAAALGTAVFTTLTFQASAHKLAQLRDTLLGSLRAVLLVTIPSAVGLAVLRVPVVTLLFQRGAFTAQATFMTASALLFYCLGLVGQAAVTVLTRGFYALQDTLTPVWVTVASVLVNLCFSLALIRPMGLGGLALANSLGSFFNTLALLWLLDRRLAGIRKGLLLCCLKVLPASALMGGVCYLALNVDKNMGALITRVGLTALAGIFTYMGLAWAMRMEEAGPVLAAFKKALSRARVKRAGSA